MNRRLPSPSSHARVAACPGSESLPHFQRVDDGAAAGVILHRFLQQVPELGRDLALEAAPEAHRATLAAIDLSRLPACEPERYRAEVAMAYDVATFRARVLHGVEGRQYDGVLPTEVAGTCDVLAVLDDHVIVYDYKSEHAPAAPARSNMQLLTYALMAARAAGVTRARAGIIRVGGDGDAWYDVADYSADVLDAHEMALVELMGRVAAGDQTLSEGAHCRYCPALPACPAKSALMRQVVSMPEQVEQAVVDMLADGRGAEAWQKLKAAEKLVERLLGTVRDYAATTPIDLPGGEVLGSKEVVRESLNGDVVHATMLKQWGVEVADLAAPQVRDATKASLERAIRVVRERHGGKISHLLDGALEAVREVGGVKTTTHREVKVFRRPK